MRLPGARTTSRRPTSPKDSVAAPNSSPPVGSASGATSVNAEMTIDAITATAHPSRVIISRAAKA